MTASESTDLKVRGSGFVLAGVGAFLLKWSFFDVLRDAEAQASSLRTSGKAVIIAPFLLVVGVLVVIIGTTADGSSRVGRHLIRPSDRRLTPLGQGLAVLGVVPGLIFYLWLRIRLEALGYG